MKRSKKHIRKRRDTKAKGNLYTRILEYNGGTYISQVAGDSVTEALSALSLQTGCSRWGMTRAELRRISEDSPVLVAGCVGVWCASGSARHGLILVHIIDTNRTQNSLG
jgi:hypothetical protein